VNDDGKVDYPWHIAFHKDGVWAVKDYINHCVYILNFDSQDKLIAKKIGHHGSGSGQFSNPRAVSFDANDHLNTVTTGYRSLMLMVLSCCSMGNVDHIMDSCTVLSNRCMLWSTMISCLLLNAAIVMSGSVTVFHLIDDQFSHIIGSGQLSSPWDVAVTTDDQLHSRHDVAD